MKHRLIFLLFSISTISLSAQKIIVKGTVKDEHSEILLGAPIYIVGHKEGIITDVDGKYSIEVHKGDSLQFSYLGCDTLKVLVDREVIDVMLKEADVEIYWLPIHCCFPKRINKLAPDSISNPIRLLKNILDVDTIKNPQ